ncbi:sugar phosphate isomerase/epimerase and 4-hydroxyphenylpyruvate domain-containing protein [Paenarthrobacter sp. DKR-5]|uniref:bifunctional sugar phosphate isomerase/epimerase/4-hydroxyphenylpyruvate dioxygenase family protein n=1 Tax=Paenarthrobacter sp. DKR-5 TaxID=2835535 RepID=UPI001BDD5F1E|nr:sugar phosphate isomerase/epimerase and 4-hydroxyphenylpyruvate domain-containing protein [Paenarthrobacter sp. DKR-5]MBT1001099.1 sugar phosphate isomerase/epimerase and 4-hydroxyphenylpyruvate domain-containing protein [Paenarthrobacter sp. DKR-5]
MRRSIATVCLSGSLDEKLRACSRAGFDGVEIFENDLVVSRYSPAEIARMAADEGLGIDLYQPFRDFEGVAPEQLQRNLRRAEAKFALMADLGADTILFCSNVATALEDNDELAADQLGQAAELAAAHGIRIAYEALAWGRNVSDFEHACRLVERVGHPALGTCLDSFHILSRGWDPAPIESLDPEKIFFVQLADAPQLSMDVLSWSRHHRVFPGEGSWDLPGFMAHLVRSGYAGTVSLEVFNDVFRQSPVDRTAVDAMRSLIWLEEQAAHRLRDETAPAAGAAPVPGAMKLATLPRVDQPSGFNFAEVRAVDAPELEAILHQLGFRFDGRHRTKPVQLWTQGNARIVVNEQQAQGHEPAISAIGFDVANPLVAASRALQLRAVPVPRQSQADEEVLQAFAAPDSTEVFLCQGSADGTAAWTSEFGPGTDAPAGPDLIGRIDHINLAQPWQHFDEAVLFYESALSLTAQPSQDVAAPTGLVRSQVMRSDDGRVRLALNIAPLALEGSGPSAVAAYPQHIALATEDLIGVARRALERGLAFLPVPQNYYDDLRARLDVPPALLGTLQELNLLYDEDDEGEFLHFYTATVGSVFFEVVQRGRHYEGYGAPNAPVRLAAQYEHSKRR